MVIAQWKHAVIRIILVASILIIFQSITFAESKDQITGYGEFVLGTPISHFGGTAGMARSFAVSKTSEDGHDVLNYDLAICNPYAIENLNGHKVEIFSRPEEFKVGDWSTPSTKCILEVYFVDGTLSGVRLVFDFLNYSADSVATDLRTDYAKLVYTTILGKYDSSLVAGYEFADTSAWCNWADASINELNFSYVIMTDIWLMTIRYTNPLYWDAYEGESEAARQETESKL